MKNNSTRLGKIRAVVFDYGEVLCAAPPSSCVASMAALFKVTPEQFRKLYSAQRQAYDRGDLTPEDYWAAIAKRAAVTLSSKEVADLRRTDVEMWSNVSQDMLHWVRDLRARGTKTAVLSNMHADMAHYAKENFAWLTDFDCLTLSSELRMVKPDAEIYLHTLRCLGTAPHETLFVDDREANIHGAEAVGMRGIVMQSAVQLRTELEAIGFAPLPA